MQQDIVRGAARAFMCCGLAIALASALTSCERIRELFAGPPVIEIATVHYMGEIESDAIAEDFVKVFNRGDSPLAITKITTQCPCTKGEMIEQVIPAGGEGVLRVTVDPSRVRGFQSTKTLTLFSNDPKNPTTEIRISALVKPGIVWEPKRLDFGEIPQGQGAERRVRLRQMQNSPLSILGDLRGGNEYVVGEVVEVPPEERAAPDKVEYDLIVRVLPEAPVSIQSHNLVLLTNARSGVVSFTAVAKIVPAGEESAGEDTGAPTDD